MVWTGLGARTLKRKLITGVRNTEVSREINHGLRSGWARQKLYFYRRVCPQKESGEQAYLGRQPAFIPNEVLPLALMGRVQGYDLQIS